MAKLRQAVLATAMISTGLLSSAGMAMAGGTDTADGAYGHGHSARTHSHGDHSDTTATDGGVTYQRGLVNSGEIKPNTSPDLCNNDLQGNLGGVQVPFNEVAAALGILSKSESGGTSPGSSRGCASPSAS